MWIRPAVAGDAAELGRVMVESWLAAHRGQMPEALWEKRVAEWTPEVSAAGWARVLAAQAEAAVPDDVLLVAEDEGAVIVGVLYGDLADDGVTGEVGAVYVSYDHHREGIGAVLLRAGAAELRRLGASALRISVLTDNVLARRFYEGMGGVEVGQGTFDEEGTLLATTVYEWSDVSALAGG